MKFRIRTGPAVLLAVAVSFALAACKPIGDDGAGGRSAADSRQIESTPGIPGIDGLDTAQRQAGYAIGLELGGTLVPIRDEVDLDAMLDGIRDTLDGREPKVDEQQFMQIMQDLGERMQAGRAQVGQRAAEEGQAFLAENAERPEVQVTGSGLQYEVLEAGEGAPPQAEDWVRAHYEGRLLDGEVFDSSIERGEPAEIPLQNVIPGWQEGLQLMPPGARYRFWIPAALAYGEEGSPGGPIGPNETLVFEVELIEILSEGQ